MKTRLLISLLAAALAACSIVPAERDAVLHTYFLNPETFSRSPAGESGKAGAATLLVSLPKARSGFDTPRMAYLLRPHEVSYYATSEWADTPARMLLPLMVQSLERTMAWRAVVRMPNTARGDYRLDSEELAIEHHFFQKPSRVRLTLRAQLVELRGQSVIGTRAFEVLEDASSDDAHGGMDAANRAVAKLLDQVAIWLSALVQSQGGN